MTALLIDIGNSRIKWRIVDSRVEWPLYDDPDQRDHKAHDSDEAGSLQLREVAQLESRFGNHRGRALRVVHLSNVAGAEVEGAMRDAVNAAWGDLPIHALIPNASQCGVVNGYRDKSQLGPDRWAALLGAHALFPDRPLLVCGFGTATTIDLMLSDEKDDRASFAGGLILPGFEAMRRMLARDTARLPLAQGEVVDFATCTDDAIASGIVAAQAGAVARSLLYASARIAAKHRASDELNRLSNSLSKGNSRSLLCVLAGGGAKSMAAHLDDIDVPIRIVPDLVLRGLHAIARDRREPADADTARHPALVRERS